MRDDFVHQPIVVATAPGKFILTGEHAVVYGTPAIACPVAGVHAKAEVYTANSGGITVDAIDINTQIRTNIDLTHPISLATNNLLQHLSVKTPPNFHIKLSSTIPIAAGLGSGAAITTALLKALAEAMGHKLATNELSDLVYEIEKLFHGTPSGIDNTVIAYAQPVWFIRDKTLQPMKCATPFDILIADTGVASETMRAVAGVRERYTQAITQYKAYFDEITEIGLQAKAAIETGSISDLGPLLDKNHVTLQHIGVSSPELDALVTAAKVAGALGAKLSGGGVGGNMIALVKPTAIKSVSEALTNAGATRVIHTQVN